VTPSGWTVVSDVEAFRRVKRSGRGVVVIRGSASTTIHHPECPHVREDAFLEKLRNGRLAYHWTDSVETAQRRWPGARACRHPSDPLAGGTGGPEAAAAATAARTAPRSGADWSVDGPSPTLRAVRAEAGFVLPYEPRTPAQLELRSELRERLRRLACRDDEVLHASFFGAKPANADVENLLLYNVDDSGGAFAGAGRGIRFELSPRELPNAAHAFAWLYRPVPRAAGFALWTPGETIAAWPAVALERPLDRAAVWLSFRTAVGGELRSHPGSFGVRVALRPGDGGAVAPPRLVKPLLDGIVAALEAHGDGTTIGAVSDRLAAATGAAPEEIERLLADASAAPLGVVPRLAHLRAGGVQLTPADDRCVAAEVLVDAAAAAGRWHARCEVVVLSPR
jgi:hypothetical protein